MLDELGWRAPATTPYRQASETVSTQDPVLKALGFDPLSLDELLDRTGMSAAALQAQLFELELGGRVARLPGGLFQQIARA